MLNLGKANRPSKLSIKVLEWPPFGLKELIIALVILNGILTTALAQSAAEATDIIKSLSPTRGQTVTPGYTGGRRESIQVDRQLSLLMLNARST
jgi:hypothetical protein